MFSCAWEGSGACFEARFECRSGVFRRGYRGRIGVRFGAWNGRLESVGMLVPKGFNVSVLGHVLVLEEVTF